MAKKTKKIKKDASPYQSDVRLGLKYQDAATGFKGTAKAIMFSLHGCQRVQLVTLVNSVPSEQWFDGPGLVPVKENDLTVGFNPSKESA